MILYKSVILLLCASVALAGSAREICAAEGSENTLIPAKNCNQFYICTQGTPLELNCQAGLVFNIDGFCDWPENVDCEDRTAAGPGAPEETPVIPDEKPEIPEQKPVIPDEKPYIPEQTPEVAAICAAEGSDGILLPAQNCAQFIKCSEGLPAILDCQPGLLYNPGGWCDWPENVNCDNRSPSAIPEETPAKPEDKPEIPEQKPETPEEKPIAPEAPVEGEPAAVCAAAGSDGLLLPAQNCAQFIKCSEGLPAILECQPGLLYNPGGWCDWPENVNCDDRSPSVIPEETPAKPEDKPEIPEQKPETPEQKPIAPEAPVEGEPAAVCAAEGSDGLLLPAQNCAQFIKCSEGLPAILDCQPGLLYNPGGWCDWPENVNCDDRSPSVIPEETPAKPEDRPEIPELKPEIPEQKPENPEDNPEAAAICAAEGSDGILVPAQNCAQFIKCSEGLPAVLDCQPGLLYNPAGWCDWPENVDCRSRAL